MKIKFNGIKNSKTVKFFLNLSFNLAKHHFLAFLVMLFFAVALSLLLVYNFSLSGKNIKIDEEDKKPIFEGESYQKIKKNWEQQEINFKKADTEEYRNIFKTKAENPAKK